MPYDIRRDVDGCDGFAVVVSTTGKRVGCHSTRAAAVRHQRALYANVPEARGKVQQAFTSKADAFDVAQLLLIDADFWDSYERELVETTRPLFEAIFFAGMKAAIRLPEVKPIVAGNLPEELTTKAVSEAVRTALANMIQTGRSVVENMMSTWASGIAQTTKDNILASLTRAREQSLGSPYVYDRIKADFDPARARRIAVTETTRFFGAGSVAVYRAAELPAWEWQTVEDGLVCPICSDLSGTQFRVASDFGPAHPSCLVAGTVVSGVSGLGIGIEAATSRVYEGDVITFRTASGKELTVTPNHPILTSSGWRAAGEFCEGDDLISYCVDVDPVPLKHPHDEQVPSLIEQIWESFSMSDSMLQRSMPISSEDFHGDGSDGEVDVVAPYSLLLDEVHVSESQSLRDVLFVAGSRRDSTLNSSGHKNAFGLGDTPTSHGLVGIRDLVHSSLWSPRRSLQPLGLAAIADRYAGVEQSASNGHSIHSKELRDHVLRHASLVEPDDFAVVEWRAIPSAFLDVVTVVSRSPFRGHVYNLQTTTGWYVANGIITHNCRCFPKPVTDLSDKEQIEMESRRLTDDDITAAGNDIANAITPQQKAAIQSYTDKAFRRLNSAKRRGAKLNPELREIDDAMTAALRPLGGSVRVYRGAKALDTADLKIGDEFVDKGFVSTSSNIEVAKNFAKITVTPAEGGKIQLVTTVMEVNVPGNVPVLPIGKSSLTAQSFAGEGEVVLNAGSAFRVTGIRYEKTPVGPMRIFETELIP